METPTPAAPQEGSHNLDVAIVRINARQAIVVAIISAATGIAGALIQGVLSSHKVEAAEKKADNLKTALDQSEADREALYRLIANHLEDDLIATSGVTMQAAQQDSNFPESEIAFRLLQRAVFLKMDVLQANRDYLAKALDELVRRGHKWVAPQKERLCAALPDLAAKRLRWLEDVAIPELQESINRANDPKAGGPRPQFVPSEMVPVPNDIPVLDKYRAGVPPYVLLVPVSSMEALKREADFLKNRSGLPGQG